MVQPRTMTPWLGAPLGLLVVTLACPCAAELTRPGAWGVGLTAGMQLPIAQQDVEWGPAIGVHGRWGMNRVLEIEPSAVFLANTDASTDSGVQLPAGHVTSVGCNALLKTGRMGWGGYAALGLGWSRRDFAGSLSSAGSITFDVGLGGEKQVGPLRLDLSPRLYILRTESGATRKHLAVQLGVTRYF